MVSVDIIQKLLIALALGALVGLEREYATQRFRASAYAGIRTFPLIALFGALSAYFGDMFNQWIFLTAMILIGLLVITAYYLISAHSERSFGATSEIAGLLTFFIGVLAYKGEFMLATLITVIMTVILYLRSVLHHFAHKMKDKELSDTLKFAIVAFVILPFLPDKGYGPHQIFNPYLAWLMVVFISGISFIGYFFMKWFGERGVALAGILGGLVSSTAVTSSFADRSKREHKIYLALVLGVILANVLMFVRIMLEISVLNQDLLPHVIIPLSLLALITLGFSYAIWKKAKKVKGKVELSSPFTIGPALKFGIIFAAVLALAKLANIYLSSRGVYIVSIISGIADVDAITVSLSQLGGASIALETARNGIIIAALTNIAVKGGIAYFMGSKEFGRIIAIFYAILIALGALFLILL